MDSNEFGVPEVPWEDFHNWTGTLAVYPEAGSGSVQAIMYTALGLAGEAGGVANQIKKILRDDEGTLRPERLGRIAKELGDAAWYWSRLCHELGLNAGEVFAANIFKLEGRRDTGTLHGDGSSRETEGDQKIHILEITDDHSWYVRHMNCPYEGAPATCPYDQAASRARARVGDAAPSGRWLAMLDESGEIVLAQGGFIDDVVTQTDVSTEQWCTCNGPARVGGEVVPHLRGIALGCVFDGPTPAPPQPLPVEPHEHVHASLFRPGTGPVDAEEEVRLRDCTNPEHEKYQPHYVGELVGCYSGDPFVNWDGWRLRFIPEKGAKAGQEVTRTFLCGPSVNVARKTCRRRYGAGTVILGGRALESDGVTGDGL